jgi:hypothetical protein
MRTLRTAAFVVAAALASAPATPTFADQPSLTEERQSSAGDNNLVWNILGALGIFGLFGLQRTTDNDGYTDDPI